MELGQYLGGLSVTALIFFVGEVASAGGIIDRFVYYTPIPLGFVVITFFEILIQTLVFGQLLRSCKDWSVGDSHPSRSAFHIHNAHQPFFWSHEQH
jgi:hypothetical protein